MTEFLYSFLYAQWNSRYSSLYEYMLKMDSVPLSVSATQWWLWASVLRATLATRCAWGNRRKYRRRTNSTCSFCSRLYLQSNRCYRDRRGRQRRVRQKTHTHIKSQTCSNDYYQNKTQQIEEGKNTTFVSGEQRLMVPTSLLLKIHCVKSLI